MRILLTNDDGFDALGIRTLFIKLREAGHHVTIVAPSQERSGTSHSITLRNSLELTRIEDDIYAVSGTPVDCMVIATQEVMKEPADLVISGVNAGQNMGEDILYSGTVAAAIEAMFLGFKSIAVSMYHGTSYHFETAAHYLNLMLEHDFTSLITNDEMINVNFPNAPVSDIRGFRITTTGSRRYENFVHIDQRIGDKTIYRVGGDIPLWSYEKGTDAEAVKENYISLTPINFNFTKGAAFPKILEWVEDTETGILQPKRG